MALASTTKSFSAILWWPHGLNAFDFTTADKLALNTTAAGTIFKGILFASAVWQSNCKTLVETV